FTAPADLAGTKVLILSPTQMYVYLPAFKKVRRIASHVTEQGFMGTTYTQDLLAVSRYGEHYTPKLAAEDEKTWTLDLSEKPGGEGPYPKVQIKVRKEDYLPTTIAYYTDKGKHVKTEERLNYECREQSSGPKICAPETMKLTDHTDNEHWTKLVQKKWTPNGGLRDRIFTRRNLRRDTRRGR
ncbi:MAG: outer membrane lipoprotein-sorting protein, partial [Myxococcota bacterium]